CGSRAQASHAGRAALAPASLFLAEVGLGGLNERRQMRLIDRIFHQWSTGFVQVFSLQLFFILVLIAAIVAYLVNERDKLKNGWFVFLSVSAGALGALAVGAAFRTPAVAWLINLPTGAIVEQSLSWIKGIIALTAA